jgi:lysophospholipase L1-like esterase
MQLKNSIDKLEKGDDLKIVALGDSLTYGWMVEKGYIDFLKEMLKVKYPKSIFKIINQGIPGDTAESGLYRLKDHVLNSDPDLVFIQFALNDAFSGYSLEDFHHNILGIINGIRNNSSAEILLMTSVALDKREKRIAERYYDILKNIAKKEAIPIVLVHEYWEKRISEGIEFSTLVQQDCVHPTVKGYRLMAEAIVKVF